MTVYVLDGNTPENRRRYEELTGEPWPRVMPMMIFRAPKSSERPAQAQDTKPETKKPGANPGRSA